MRQVLVFFLAFQIAAATLPEARSARDKQDRAALEKVVQGLQSAAAAKPNDDAAHYRLALAQSYLAEISLELRQKNEARNAAVAGIKAAEKAVELKPSVGEYHRILGTLCGQVVPANVLAGLKYARCAMDSVNKSVELNPKSADAWLSHGVGNYYLPAQFGGGVPLAIEDIKKAVALDPKSADAWMWLGVAYRKANNNTEARKALEKSLQLNPKRVWTKELLDKTPQS
ncbi:MAG: tetratricopeptide repeat protein [Bryobacterales bacterium]|nr:tetratricopeptide repeat protein [Bryobacterales bacterium]